MTTGYAGKIIGCAINVHKELGPGFLESICEEAMAYELSRQKISFERQVPVNVTYQQKIVGLHRVDLVIEQKVVVELKAIKLLDDIHIAIALSYLKATRLKVASILNFSQLTAGVKRVSRDKPFKNEFAEPLSLQKKSYLKVDGLQFVPDNLVTINNIVQGPDSNGKKSGISNQQKGARAIIPPRSGAALKRKNIGWGDVERNRLITEKRFWGQKEWKRVSNYHRRSLAETGMFRYKRILGGTLHSRKLENQKIEARIGAMIINKMTQLGMPVSYKL